MQQQKKEKVRIFALARELGMESKDLVVFCQQHGLDVKSQLSTIEPEVRDQILQLVKKGAAAAPAPPPPPAPPQPAAPPVVSKRPMQTIAAPRTTAAKTQAPSTVPAPAPTATATPVSPPDVPSDLPDTPAALETAPTHSQEPAEQVPEVAPTPVVREQVEKVTEVAPVAPTVAPASAAPAAIPEIAASAIPPAPVAPAQKPASVAAKATPVTPPEKQPIPAEKTLPPAPPAPPAQTTPPAQPAVPAQPAAPAAAAKQPETPRSAPRTGESPKPAATKPAQPAAPRPAAQTPAVATPTPTAQPTTTPQTGQAPRTPAVPVASRNPIRTLTSRPAAPQNQGAQGGGSSGTSQPPQGGATPATPPAAQTPPTGQGTGQGGQSSGPRPTRPVQGGGKPAGSYGVTPSPRPVQKGQQPPAGQAQAKPTQTPSGAPVKIGNITPEMLAQFSGREKPPTPKELLEAQQRIEKQARTGPVAAPTTAPVPDTEESEDDRRRGGSARAGTGPGAVPGRADRHKERNERQKARKGGEQEGRGGKPILKGLDDEVRHRKARPHIKVKRPPTMDRIGKVPVYLPITVRSLSEAIGKKAMEVIFKLKDHGQAAATINSSIEPDVAEVIALDFGREIEIKRSVDVEQDLIDERKREDKPEDLVSRAPIVTIMGHVDHGKTSLLDRIRQTYGLKSDVVSTEAGGITQVIRAWRVEMEGKPITFLDTPGHEAFTKMRARGANVTDIAVIVVAANDGVMPQTEEAISHAKAAGVSIVVAINKVDLPDANIGKTERRLMDLELIPDTMGGEVPFVQTSAKSGKGIADLLEQLSVVAELKELKANPNKPATGTCLEAHKSEKEGVQATLLVRDGTLKTGDVVLCGSSFGTVRRMYDDHGRTIDEAGPSVPVRILGLDEVPNADDPFLVVEDLATARQIAEDRKDRDLAKSLVPVARGLSLDDLRGAKITELKVILKAEARGSIEAIRNELEKLQHDEVRVRVLHAAIGGITEGDVQLALASPQDSIVVGFNVVPDNDAKALAEERGIQVRQYNIIYQLADDIRSALEGKLKPREEVVQLGRAIVRNTFKISRVGTIAGCYVTQGVMERNAKVRVIRGGVVVYPPAERTVGLDSLKRFRDDAREVREGFECGLKITGYDDIKVDDVIECYRVEQVQRTLDNK